MKNLSQDSWCLAWDISQKHYHLSQLAYVAADDDNVSSDGGCSYSFLVNINVVCNSLQNLKNNYNSVNVTKVLLGTWPQCLV
jgi:hypothetical protein